MTQNITEKPWKEIATFITNRVAETEGEFKNIYELLDIGPSDIILMISTLEDCLTNNVRPHDASIDLAIIITWVIATNSVVDNLVTDLINLVNRSGSTDYVLQHFLESKVELLEVCRIKNLALSLVGKNDEKSIKPRTPSEKEVSDILEIIPMTNYALATLPAKSENVHYMSLVWLREKVVENGFPHRSRLLNYLGVDAEELFKQEAALIDYARRKVYPVEFSLDTVLILAHLASLGADRKNVVEELIKIVTSDDGVVETVVSDRALTQYSEEQLGKAGMASLVSKVKDKIVEVNDFLLSFEELKTRLVEFGKPGIFVTSRNALLELNTDILAQYTESLKTYLEIGKLLPHGSLDTIILITYITAMYTDENILGELVTLVSHEEMAMEIIRGARTLYRDVLLEECIKPIPRVTKGLEDVSPTDNTRERITDTIPDYFNELNKGDRIPFYPNEATEMYPHKTLPPIGHNTVKFKKLQLSTDVNGSPFVSKIYTTKNDGVDLISLISKLSKTQPVRNWIPILPELEPYTTYVIKYVVNVELGERVETDDESVLIDVPKYTLTYISGTLEKVPIIVPNDSLEKSVDCVNSNNVECIEGKNNTGVVLDFPTHSVRVTHHEDGKICLELVTQTIVENLDSMVIMVDITGVPHIIEVILTDHTSPRTHALILERIEEFEPIDVIANLPDELVAGQGYRLNFTMTTVDSFGMDDRPDNAFNITYVEDSLITL